MAPVRAQPEVAVSVLGDGGDLVIGEALTPGITFERVAGT
jgi:hypothetical protein